MQGICVGADVGWDVVRTRLFVCVDCGKTNALYWENCIVQSSTTLSIALASISSKKRSALE